MNQWQNYPNPVNTYYQSILSQQMPSFNQAQNQMPQINSRFVTNIEEAKAAMIDPLSYNLFLDISNGKIYLKKLGNNGQSEFLSYTSNDVVQNKPVDPLQEIKSRLGNIEQFLGEMKYGKSISNDASVEQSTAVTQPTVANSHESNDEAEPSGVSKSYGTNFWQK